VVQHDSEFRRICRRFYELGMDVGKSERLSAAMSDRATYEGDVVSLEEWRRGRDERRREA
jgi:hypothetical protein